MGWENLKEHFRIEHIVEVRKDGGVNIGSGYVSKLIIVKADGTFAWGSLGESRNDDLARYAAEMTAAGPEKVRELLAATDTFHASIPIYTYDDGTILEKFCEVPEWPNLTHDGHVIYENTFSTDKAKVVARAKRNARLGVKNMRERVAETEQELAKQRARLAQEEADVVKLDADYPDIKGAGSS